MRDLNDTQVKACSQNWTLVKTIEEELTKMREEMEKNLEQGLQKNCSEQLTKDVTIDMNQLVDMCNATKKTTDNLSKELSQLQKSMKGLYLIMVLKGGYPIIFASNVFHNSHLIQKCIQNQQLILYTLLNQMRVVKNIRRKDDRMNSL